jgi:hypothetical protein
MARKEWDLDAVSLRRESLTERSRADRVGREPMHDDHTDRTARTGPSGRPRFSTGHRDQDVHPLPHARVNAPMSTVARALG